MSDPQPGDIWAHWFYVTDQMIEDVSFLKSSAEREWRESAREQGLKLADDFTIRLIVKDSSRYDYIDPDTGVHVDLIHVKIVLVEGRITRVRIGFFHERD